MSTEGNLAQELDRFGKDYSKLRDALAGILIGQAEAIDLTLAALLGGGHVLVGGPPGVGKTLLGRTLAELLDVDYRRIQFTSDLMPADIIGTYVVMEVSGRRRFEFQQGPIFTNLLLADEINRATPKTQAALFEALEERALSVANETYALPDPFFAIATQSLGDIEGTFPVPETQLDRFAFKLTMPQPASGDLERILQQSTQPATASAGKVLTSARLTEMCNLVRQVGLPGDILKYVAKLLMATHPQEKSAPESARRFVQRGASPRGGQAMILGAKALAAVAGRTAVSKDDINRLALPALRHRISLNFEGHAEETGIDGIIQDILNAVQK